MKVLRRRVYNKPRCFFRSPLMKTLDWSVETLGREYFFTRFCIHFNKTRVASETWLLSNILYSFFPFVANKKVPQLKPLTAIKAMLRTNCYRCLCHPVCCKYLKAKWREFGWKVYSASLLVYVVFLISLSVYAFGIPSYQKSLENITSFPGSGNGSGNFSGNEFVKNKGRIKYKFD